MKKFIIPFALTAAMLAFVGCKDDKTPEEPGPGPKPPVEETEVDLNLTATADVEWAENDVIGVYTDAAANVEFKLTEGAGTKTAVFTAKVEKDSEALCAYYPYNAGAGDDMNSVLLNVPVEVSAAEPAYRFAVANKNAAGELEFVEKTANVKVVLENAEISTYRGVKVAKVIITGTSKHFGSYKAVLGESSKDIKSTSNASETLTLNYPDGLVFDENFEAVGTIAPPVEIDEMFSITIVTEEGREFKATSTPNKATDAGKTMTLKVNTSLFEPNIALVWAYGGSEAFKNGFTGHVPAIDNQGNVYVTHNGSSNLTKINSDGSFAWKQKINKDEPYSSDVAKAEQKTSPSIEADGSAIYACYGNSQYGYETTLTKFTPDGTAAWYFDRMQFFRQNKTAGNSWGPYPGFNQIAPAIGTDRVYIGNRGDSGTVLAVDKNEGKRKGYVSGDQTGLTGPSGGIHSGVALTSSHGVSWICGQGMFAANATLLDNPEMERTDGEREWNIGKYVPYGYVHRHLSSGGYWDVEGSSVAATKINGEDWFVSYGRISDANGAGQIQVFGFPASLGLGTTSPTWAEEDAHNFYTTPETDVRSDQGGIVIGPKNEAIIPLKNNGGHGGLLAVNLETRELAWQYKCGADVGGAAAVDDHGNIHVADDNGIYHIIKPNYENKEVRVVAEVNLKDLAANNNVDLEGREVARCWTSTMIGDDGKMYVAVTFRNADKSGGIGFILCMSYEGSTGPGKTAWPMKFADCRHSGVQHNI